MSDWSNDWLLVERGDEGSAWEGAGCHQATEGVREGKEREGEEKNTEKRKTSCSHVIFIKAGYMDSFVCNYMFCIIFIGIWYWVLLISLMIYHYH